MWRWLLVIAIGCGGQGSTPDGGTTSSTTYKAFVVIGGLDRIRIVKASPTTCFSISLVHLNPTSSDISLPMDWFFESAQAMQPAAACDPSFTGPILNEHAATGQDGEIVWSGALAPMVIDRVLVSLAFGNNPLWCPPVESLERTDVVVQ